jgi:hypothetical protein
MEGLVMRKVLGTVLVVLFSAVLAFAQEGHDRDDHDDKAPVQSGYAVITPVAATTGGTTTGLVVFESYGLRGGPGGTTQAGVLPPDLTTSSLLFVDSSGRLAKNLGVAIVNPNTSSANVALTLRKDDGTQVATTTITVPSLHQTSKFVSELFSGPPSVPSEIKGTLAITSAGSSNLPVSVIGLRFRGSNFSTIPATNLAPAAVPSTASGLLGPGAVLLPQFAAGGGWATEIVLVNSNTTSLTVRVDLYKQDGTPLTASLNGQTASTFTNLNVPANGVLILAPRDKNGDDDF